MTSSDEERPTTPPTSLQAPISPPRSRRSKPQFSNVDDLNPGVTTDRSQNHSAITAPTLASIEAGEFQIQDHLSYFSAHLARAVRPKSPGPRLSIPDFVDLYQRNCHPHGRHFVVHQHDHPVAGLHYDLRLQISETSSISFAIMYGLPGNPNSRRLNRNATETRVHCLWVGFFGRLFPCTVHILFFSYALPASFPARRRISVVSDHYERTVAKTKILASRTT